MLSFGCWNVGLRRTRSVTRSNLGSLQHCRTTSLPNVPVAPVIIALIGGFGGLYLAISQI